MKKRNIFILSNALLVVIVGIIIGLSCGSYIFAETTGIVAFICFLLTLCAPIAIYLLTANANTGAKISSVLFVGLEFVINLLFIIKPSWNLRAFGIIQAIVIGLLFIAVMVNVALFSNKE